MSPNFTLIYLACAIIISAVIGVYAWIHRESRGCRAFAVLILVSITWMGGAIFRDLEDLVVWQRVGGAIQYLGIAGVPPALLVFVFRYCGKRISRRRILLLSIVPFVSWIILGNLPNLLGFLITGKYDPSGVMRQYYLWGIHIPYSYSLLVTSLVTVFFEIRRAATQYRGQIMLLFVAMCIPVTADLLGLAGVLGNINLSPLSFLIFFILVAISIARYQFLGNNPLAYETVFHTIRDCVIILDRDDVIRDINLAAAHWLAREPKAVIGLSFKEAFSDMLDVVESFEVQKYRITEIDMTVTADKSFLSLAITPLEDIDGTLCGRIVMLRDVTERKQQQMSLETLAFHDPLTRLANRRKFTEEVETAMLESSATGKNFAILFMDLNRFKIVNDTMGHDVGDELLKYVAARIASTLRKPDLLARIGGDEFAILLHNSNENGVEHVVERMIENVQRPFNVGKHTLTVSLSIGAAFYPADGNDLTQLLRHADAAMYRAKSQGGGLTHYSPGSEMEN
jgi:diguanylate cyclase (GGDEF)-like protein/PAS domain S-box-containing protein